MTRQFQYSQDKIKIVIDLLQVFSVLSKQELLGYVRVENLLLNVASRNIYVNDINFNQPNYSEKAFGSYIAEAFQRIFKLSQIAQLKQLREKGQLLHLKQFNLRYEIQCENFIWQCSLTKSQQVYYCHITILNKRSQMCLGKFCLQSSQKQSANVSPVKLFILCASGKVRNSAELKHKQYILIKNEEGQNVVKLEQKRVREQATQNLQYRSIQADFLKQVKLSGNAQIVLLEQLQKKKQEKIQELTTQQIEELAQKQQKLSKDQLKSQEFPFNCVGKIFSKMSRIGFSGEALAKQRKITYLGTGTLINPYIVLTCAHNCINYDKQNSRFSKVFEASDITFILSAKTHKVRDFRYCQKYNKHNRIDSSYDFALLFLETPIRLNQYIDIAKDYNQFQEPIYIKGFTQVIVGVNDRQIKQTIEESKSWGIVEQYNIMRYDAQTKKGYSGGSVLVDFTRRHFFIIGIHIVQQKYKTAQKKTIQQAQLQEKLDSKNESVKKGVYFTSQVIKQFMAMQRQFISKYGTEMAQRLGIKKQDLQIFRHVIKYKNIYTPKVDQYNKCFQQLMQNKQRNMNQIMGYIPTLLVGTPAEMKVEATNSVAILNGLMNVFVYDEETRRFGDLKEGTFPIIAYFLNHIRIFWERIKVSNADETKFKIFLQKIQLNKKLIYSQTFISQTVKKRTLEIFKQSKEWTQKITANPALLQILKMITLLSIEVGELFQKRNYKIYATQMCVAALLAFKIFKAIQATMMQSLAMVIKQAVVILTEIFWLCSEYDTEVFKSTILSVVKYIQINAINQEEKKHFIYICHLFDGRFERLQHNSKLDKKFIPILNYLRENKSYIFLEKEDK